MRLDRWVFILAFLCLTPFAYAGDIMVEVLSPALAVAEMPRSSPSAMISDPPYLSRSGFVQLKTDHFFPKTDEAKRSILPQASFNQSGLSMSFFPNEFYVLIIDSESRRAQDVLSINGHIEGQDISTFSMTITPDNYLITLHDLCTAKLYRVVGHTDSGEGRVREIDLKKTPPVNYKPPLIPPVEKK